MRSAFVPSPEAKMAIFSLIHLFVHIIYKIVQRNCIYLAEYLYRTRNIYSFAPKIIKIILFINLKQENYV